MRDYKVTYESVPLGYVTIRDSHIVTAESKQEAVDIAMPNNCKLISVRLMPIKKVKKPFDIAKHEFSDKDIRLSNLCESKIELAVDDCGIEHYFTLRKSDAIAIAKALGVTGEDLK